MNKGININATETTRNAKMAVSFRRMKAKKQKGFTLIELTAAVVIIGAVIGAAMGGKYLLAWYNGKSEGEVMANAINCARASWTGSLFTGVTLRNLVDNSCFPAESSSNKGAATASATNTFGTAYTVAAAQINVANDAIQVSSASVPSGSCPSAVQAVNSTAGVIQVTAGATTTTVKAAGQPVNDGNVATACGSAATVTIIARSTKTGN